MTRSLSSVEAAAALGVPESVIRTVARGCKLKGQEALPPPRSFTVQVRRFVGSHGGRYRAITRQELRADGELIWAREHSAGLFDTPEKARGALDARGGATPL